jgi:formylglycine-generating enzyme required for sulfatase activity
MTTQNRSSGISTLGSPRLTLLAAALLLAAIGGAQAQHSSLGIRMIPVTITVPQLQLYAPPGTTNALEVSTNLTAWQDLTTLVFTSSNLTWVDLFPRGGAYYRLRRVFNGGNQPPFPPPLTNLVWIPPGQFVMGSPDAVADPDAQPEEQPQTTVTLTKGFFIGKYEVTWGEYAAVTATSPLGETNYPVDSVSWTAATNFCRLMTVAETLAGRLPAGYAYRLPTEAEWEYAARAGATNRFSWGNDFSYTVLSNYAWYTANSVGTQPAGQKQANAWGLYDTSGNVCEWCLNGYGDSTLPGHPGGSVIDPPAGAVGPYRVFRGGSYMDDGSSCRPAARKSITESSALPIFGFRVVLAATGP